MPENPDHLLQSYHFTLPEELIAQHPPLERTASRLMVLDRANGATTTAQFADLAHFLPANSLLVANNSKVIPARLHGFRRGGGKAEVLLLTPLPLIMRNLLPTTDLFPDWQRAEAECLIRPAKKMQVGEILSISDGLALELVEKQEFGHCRMHVIWRGSLQQELEHNGSIPLPPYIRRKKEGASAESGDWGSDADRYQTTYARNDKAGSVAAPTAGLHFSPSLLEALRENGHEWAEVTLYVGYGTFSPVRSADIRTHAMHPEYVELPEETVQAVNRAKQEGRPVIAVGTTSCRVLEGVAERQFSGSNGACGGLSAFAGHINTFLYPGRLLRVIDGLITNFHLPESSLLMLVSALAGRERILKAYAEAVQRRFRFFSYGDAMFIR